MTTPIEFTSRSPNFELPLLFPGQSQKEFFVNQAISMIDALLPRILVSSLTTPPGDAAEGKAYRVLEQATGAWDGQDQNIAIRISDDWQFVQPLEGLSVFDQEAGQTLIFRSIWRSTNAPDAPTGGGVIDIEARNTLSAMLETMRDLGIYPDGA